MALVEAGYRFVLAVRQSRSKKTQQPLPPGRRKTQAVYVPSPTVPGHRERVQRVADTIDTMFARKQLTERQNRAAEIYRGAWATIGSSVGGSMDFDRVRGGGLPGQPLAMRYMDAAAILSDAKLKLYTRDHEVLELVARDGHSQAEAADMLHGGKATRAEREDVGRRLKDGLNELADRWLGPLFRKESDGRIVSERNFDPSEFEVKTGELQRTGRVAHATRKGVKMQRKP
jgi:hypothetical protein